MDEHQPLTVVQQSLPANNAQLHPLVQMMQTAVSAGGAVDMAMMKEMMQLQRDFEADNARKSFTRALVALKYDLPAIIAHDSVVDFTTQKGRTYYTHSSMAAVMEAITGPLGKHGFTITYAPATPDNGRVSVTCRLTHSDGHFQESTISAPPDNGSGRNALQAVASSMTYLQRYTVLSMLGIATADMKEPEPEGSTDDTVDPERNLRAVSAIVKLGKTKDEAERFAGKPVDRWTIGDLKKLQAWAKPQKSQE